MAKAKQTVSNIQLLADSKPRKGVDLTQITKAAVEMIQIEKRLQVWFEKAKELQQRHRELEENVIPDLMAAAGMTQITLEGSIELIIKDIVSGSIPTRNAIESCDDAEQRSILEQRRKEAFSWLRKNKAGELIRATLKAEFGAGHTKDAKDFYKQILRAGFKVSSDENVHPQSLNSFLRERLTAGQAVPVETFALYNGKRAQLQAPRVKKINAA
jgi:hypothetical protein